MELIEYACHSKVLLGNIILPKDAVLCRDVNCRNIEHSEALCSFYNRIVPSLITASKHLCRPRQNRGNVRRCLNIYMEAFHSEARNAFKKWAEAGKATHVLLFEQKKHTNAQFKYALHHIKRGENSLQCDSLARKLQTNSINDFLEEIKAINNSKAPTPSIMDGVSSSDEICLLWQKKYQE